MPTASWTAPTTLLNLIPQANLNALANGAWATGAAAAVQDNATNGHFVLDVEVVLSSAVTAGATAPRIDLYLLPIPDGTTPPTPPGTSAAATPAHYWVGSILAVASASFTRGNVTINRPLPPGKWALVLQNNLGVALPSTNTSSVTGYSYTEEA